MARDLRGQEVIALARPRHGEAGIGLALHARTRLRQHRDVDAGAVHLGKAVLVEIGEAAAQLGKHRRINMLRERLGIGLKSRRHEMLFEGDLLHFGHAGGGS
ncbi:hypothetical protein D3C86_1724540 [compost metagenome]